MILRIYTLFLCFFFVGISCLSAQLSGTITDTNGEPLPFASIYVKGSTKGTTSNVEGVYTINLEPGTYQMVYQYVGYKQKVITVDINTEAITKNVQLESESVKLSTVEVKADSEDPAYRVIREAIKKRKYYLNQIEQYTCEVYVKGNIKFLDAPEKILGYEVGDIDGTLDSNRQGIVYLSESQAKLAYKNPGKFKEEMLYTKVSGNDNGFGFNRASEMDFNLYENYSLFSRQIISPIASNALSYYRYRLEGVTYDEAGRLINKIEVIPKRSEDPVYRGYVYIIEDLWNFQSVELLLTTGSMKIPGLDSLAIQQVYVPVQEPDAWKIFTQNIKFKIGTFGFKLGGAFTSIYSSYDVDPQLSDKYFDNQVFTVKEGANEKDYDFWASVRPIPLTEEESVDYVRKDSLQEVRKSKVYLDSVDAKNNQFKPLDLLFGYDYDRSYNKEYFSFKSPLNTVFFNTVQGWNFDLDFQYSKYYGDNYLKALSLNPKLNYGFSDKQLRASLAFSYRFNRINYARLSVSGGREATQFNSRNPITNMGNTIASIWSKRNYMKLYDRTYGQVGWSQELFNGVYINSNISYNDRKALVNRSDYSLRNPEGREYTSNDPTNPNNDGLFFDPHQALVLNASLRIRINQKYSRYPEEKYSEGTKWPDFWIVYKKGINAFGSDVNYDFLSLQLRDNYIPAGVWGYSKIRLEVGQFINDGRLQFMDWRHFNGNQLDFSIPSRYIYSFKDLPYYSHSTNNRYFEAHFEHYFNGFILDKIPAIRKLGFMLVGGAAYLKTAELPAYYEFSLGLDRIGFGPLRLFRVDGVAAYTGNDWNYRVLIGVAL